MYKTLSKKCTVSSKLSCDPCRAMKTGILGLKTEKGTQREEHRKKPENQAFWSVPAMMPSITGLKRGKETQHEVHCHKQYQPCHTTAAVLLDHTGHDAEHLGPDDTRRDHNARYIVTSKTSTASEPLSLSTTSAARKRGGTRRPPLPPLLPLPLGRRCRRGCLVAPLLHRLHVSEVLRPPRVPFRELQVRLLLRLLLLPRLLLLLLLLLFLPVLKRHIGRGRRALCGQRRRHQRAPEQQGEDPGQPRDRPWLPPNAPLAPSGRQGAHQLSSPSSVPVGRRASCLATHPSESCGEWPRRAPLRRSSARVEATSGAVAPSSSLRRRSQRSQLPSTARVQQQATRANGYS